MLRQDSEKLRQNLVARDLHVRLSTGVSKASALASGRGRGANNTTAMPSRDNNNMPEFDFSRCREFAEDLPPTPGPKEAVAAADLDEHSVASSKSAAEKAKNYYDKPEFRRMSDFLNRVSLSNKDRGGPNKPVSRQSSLLRGGRPQEEQARMARAEEEQRADGDTFFGIDRVVGNEALELGRMAAAEGESRHREAEDARRDQLNEWELRAARKKATERMLEARDAKVARDRYMRHFTNAESSEDISYYDWNKRAANPSHNTTINDIENNNENNTKSLVARTKISAASYGHQPHGGLGSGAFFEAPKNEDRGGSPMTEASVFTATSSATVRTATTTKASTKKPFTCGSRNALLADAESLESLQRKVRAVERASERAKPLAPSPFSLAVCEMGLGTPTVMGSSLMSWSPLARVACSSASQGGGGLRRKRPPQPKALGGPSSSSARLPERGGARLAPLKRSAMALGSTKHLCVVDDEEVVVPLKSLDQQGSLVSSLSGGSHHHMNNNIPRPPAVLAERRSVVRPELGLQVEAQLLDAMVAAAHAYAEGTYGAHPDLGSVHTPLSTHQAPKSPSESESPSSDPPRGGNTTTKKKGEPSASRLYRDLITAYSERPFAPVDILRKAFLFEALAKEGGSQENRLFRALRRFGPLREAVETFETLDVDGFSEAEFVELDDFVAEIVLANNHLDVEISRESDFIE